MARSDVLTLVDTFSLSVADATESGIYYDEIVRELGFSEVLTSTEVQSVSAQQGTLTLAPDTIRALEMYSSAVGKLDTTNTNALRAIYGNSWKRLGGTTVAYSQDEENDNTVRLAPVSANPITMTIVRTDARTDVPVWLELPIALEILSREMSRESDHQDVKFAVACAKVGQLLFNLLGVMLSNKPMEKRSGSN